MTLNRNQAGKKVYVEFDGVMANSDVWVNDVKVGSRPNGYVGFRYDITDQVRFDGTPNIIAVRSDTERQPASRWYAGAGIYRHARLILTDPVHLVAHGTSVATPFVAANTATIEVKAEAVNESSKPREVRVRVELLGPDGYNVALVQSAPQWIGAGSVAKFTEHLWVGKPQLWDVGKGVLYTAKVTLQDAATSVASDGETIPFGIREILFMPERGFVLNTRDVKIKGVCLHHDGGPVGAAVPLGVWEYRLTQLRKLGVNAIRTAHNPPAPEFLDLCDRMGFLVMDEMFDCWTVGKNPFDYHLNFVEWSRTDTRDTVRRDRNHPSVILWSAGNEIHDTPNGDMSKVILRNLVDTFHENDAYRPVTQALFRPNVSHDYDNGLADILDVVGQNYRENELKAAADQKPSRKVIGTENGHGRPIWLAMRDDKRIAGQFLWAGIDYLGEARTFPQNTSGSGLLDRTGFIKTGGYERQSWWSDAPMVYAVRRVAQAATQAVDPGYEAATPAPRNQGPTTFADWTPTRTDAHDENVEVYSNCASVELFLNGNSLGSKDLPQDASPRQWRVAYAPGTLKAVGKDKAGKQIATYEVHTASAPAAVRLTSNRTTLAHGFDNVAFLEANIVDVNGNLVPAAKDTVTFEVSGPAEIIAVDNGNIRSIESFQGNARKPYLGRCVAIVRATGGTGPVTIRATSAGITTGEASILIDDTVVKTPATTRGSGQ